MRYNYPSFFVGVFFFISTWTCSLSNFGVIERWKKPLNMCLASIICWFSLTEITIFSKWERKKKRGEGVFCIRFCHLNFEWLLVNCQAFGSSIAFLSMYMNCMCVLQRFFFFNFFNFYFCSSALNSGQAVATKVYGWKRRSDNELNRKLLRGQLKANQPQGKTPD